MQLTRYKRGCEQLSASYLKWKTAARRRRHEEFGVFLLALFDD
jgi:hypothetical protein